MKKTIYAAATLLGNLAIITALLAGAGCESTEEASVAISPGYVELAAGDSVTLTASGWSTYRWSLGESSGGTNGNDIASEKGTLSSTTGERVIYRSASGARGTTQEIYCYAVASSGQTEVIAPGHATIVHK